MSAYEDRCRLDCQWCAEGSERTDVEEPPPFPKWKHYIKDRWVECTAPLPEQFAEEQASQSKEWEDAYREAMLRGNHWKHQYEELAGEVEATRAQAKQDKGVEVERLKGELEQSKRALDLLCSGEIQNKFNGVVDENRQLREALSRAQNELRPDESEAEKLVYRILDAALAGTPPTTQGDPR